MRIYADWSALGSRMKQVLSESEKEATRMKLQLITNN